MLPGNATDIMVESLVNDMLTKTKLEFLPENELTDVVTDFVQNYEKDAIQNYLDTSLKATKTLLKDQLNAQLENDEEWKTEITRAKETRFDQYASHHAPRTVTHGTAPPKEDLEGQKTTKKRLEEVKNYT